MSKSNRHAAVFSNAQVVEFLKRASAEIKGHTNSAFEVAPYATEDRNGYVEQALRQLELDDVISEYWYDPETSLWFVVARYEDDRKGFAAFRVLHTPPDGYAPFWQLTQSGEVFGAAPEDFHVLRDK